MSGRGGELLHAAAAEGNLDAVRNIISQGVPVDAKGNLIPPAQ